MLKVGKNTTKELQEWFGVSKNTYSKKKAELLQDLENYCEFEEVYGGVNITQLYVEDAEYIKPKDKVQQRITELYNKTWNNETGLDTNRDVVCRIIEKEPWMLQQYKPSSLEAIGNGVRRQLFGKQYEEAGELGKCKFVLVTRGEDGDLRFLTEEEKTMKDRFFNECFNDAKDSTIAIQKLIDDGVVKQEDAWGYYQTVLQYGKSGWGGFFKRMKDAGCALTRATLVERNGINYLEELPEGEFARLA